MPEIMTTKEVAKYLRLHEITVCKHAAEGKMPAVRVGRVWRFDKEAIDKWISGGDKKPQKNEKPKPVNKSKAKIAKKPVKVSAAATVLAVIKRSRKGVDVSTLRKKTGFESRKISGIVQRFKKEGKIKNSGKGIYVKA